jgi:hypothetical protein
MLNRWIGILSAAAMIVATFALVERDVLPNYRLGDPPPNEALLLQPGEERHAQVGIYDATGRGVGKSWTRSRRTSANGLVIVLTTTLLEPMAVGTIATPRVRIETELTFNSNELTVDELDFRMFGLPVDLSMRGEAMPSGEFPLEWEVGEQRGAYILDSRAPAALGDVIRPFDRLPDLHVGRSWKLKLLDPLAQMIPQMRETGLELEGVLIEVTGKEPIVHRGEQIEAFVVEGGGATAWVAPDGRVLLQQVNLPLLGKLLLREEEYDEAARLDAVRATPGVYRESRRRGRGEGRRERSGAARERAETGAPKTAAPEPRVIFPIEDEP